MQKTVILRLGPQLVIKRGIAKNGLGYFKRTIICEKLSLFVEVPVLEITSEMVTIALRLSYHSSRDRSPFI